MPAAGLSAAALKELPGEHARVSGSHAPSVTSSVFGQKLRLNVTARVDDTAAGKVLVCIDGDALIVDLASKVQEALRKAGIRGKLLRLTNSLEAHLPGDERVADVLRDSDEILALIGAGTETEDASVQKPSASVREVPPVQLPGASNISASERARRPSFPQAGVDASPRPGACRGAVAHALPGPSEVFEDDMRRQSPPHMGAGGAIVLPSSAGAVDWSLDGLTPKLREFVAARFSEAHSYVAGPGQAFITISMRPQERPGSVLASSAMPIQYHVARMDIIEFERLAKGKMQESRCRADYFQRCQGALHSMSSQGATRNDYAPNMLPYKYRADGEVGNLLSEADSASFGQIEGFRPVIVLDTSGAIGEKLPVIREGMKRMLYSFVVSKSKFNLVKCGTHGRAAYCWEQGVMVSPTAQRLREAEDWLDGLRPVRGISDFANAMYLSMALNEADVIYVVTSGFSQRAHAEFLLRDIRAKNVRDLPIHVIGIECDAKSELDLRRLAEENHGSFRQKRFDGQPVWSSGSAATAMWRSALGGSVKHEQPDNDDQRLTIGGQLEILDVMLKEQEIQTIDWLEEQKCANRLLLSTATQGGVSEPDQARLAMKRSAMNHLGPCNPVRLQELLEGPPGASLRRPPTGPLSGGSQAAAAATRLPDPGYVAASSRNRASSAAGGYSGSAFPCNR
eukprot:TRINITY_DN32204_c0_g1_i2.p1 TRINITY_DN32204_c0_g1~~TRINITY_DN32204_c0_g1_i2.p1  ORF type:complete len:682 (-),score=139.34 TRINITY_DN32204_c0_g1_i2:159-2204(-)